MVPSKGNASKLFRGNDLRYLLMLFVMAFLCLPTVQGVDVFGQEELAEGELSLSEQKDLYQQFFGKADKAASNSKKRLELAMHLRKQYEDDKFDALRRYICQRIDELTTGSKKKEAYELQVFVLQEQRQGKEPDYKSNEALIAALLKLSGKAAKEDKTAILQEVAGLHNVNAAMSITEKKWERAQNDYKALASLLKKSGDKDGAGLANDALDAIDDYVDALDDIAELRKKADADESNLAAHKAVSYFLMADAEWAEALSYVKHAGSPDLHFIADVASKEAASEEEKGEGNCCHRSCVE